MNWISKFIKPKLNSLLKKSSERDALWQNCSCSKLTIKEDFAKIYLYTLVKATSITNKQRFDLFFDDSEYEILDYEDRQVQTHLRIQKNIKTELKKN